MESKVAKLGQLLLSVFIIYSMWFKEAYANISLVLYGTVILATVCTAVIMARRNFRISLYKFVTMLFLYGAYSLISGVIVARDISWFSSMIITYFAFALVCFDCYFISRFEESTHWILTTFKIASVLCAIQTIFFGVDYQTEVIVRTMGVDNNPHTLGMTMVLGIFSFTSKKRDINNSFIKTIIAILAFFYVIILSGSRKSLFCALVLILMWVVFLLRKNNGSKTKKILMVLGVLVMFCIGFYYVAVYFFQTATFERLLLISSSANTRNELFRTAVEYWKQSPLIGIGFGQYQIWSPLKLYSHSSYGEILSCTGIIGVIIFFGTLLKYTINIIKCNINCCAEQKYDYRMVLIMIIIEWILGVGQIYIYSAVHLLLLTYLVMSIEYVSKEYSN